MTTNPTPTTKGMTGYQVHKLVSAALVKEGLKGIPAQMVYNYIKNNLIRSYVTVDGQRLVKAEDAQAWVTKYVGNKKARTATV